MKRSLKLGKFNEFYLNSNAGDINISFRNDVKYIIIGESI